MPDEVAEVGENGAPNVQTAAEKAVTACNPDGCREGASAGGATRGQGARNGAKGGDYRPIARHQARADPSVRVGTGGPWQACAAERGVGKADERFATSPLARRRALLAKVEHDRAAAMVVRAGQQRRPLAPVLACVRQPGRQQSSVASLLPRRTARSRRRSLALAGPPRGPLVGKASAAVPVCRPFAGRTCLEVMCIARRRGVSSARHLAAAGARSLATRR